MTDTEFLLEKYSNGICTPAEKKKVEAWLDAHEVTDNAWENMPEAKKQVWMQALQEDINLEIMGKEQFVRRSRSGFVWIAAAAVAALVFGVWLFNSKYQDTSVKTGSIASVNDIAPGKNGATITLANGEVIALNGAKKGVIIGNDKLVYDDGSALSPRGRDGRSPERGNQSIDPSLSQSDISPSRGERGMMLIASTTKGQTYEFTLSDGTHVWLNADSKISFPSQFNEPERKIMLDGEGYFEVAKDKAHPFVVSTDRQTITVLGTHFNINSYDNEIVTTTTLLEGSVKVAAFNSASGRTNVVLKPNQQYLSNKEGGQLLEVNAEDAIDWKNGDFIFDEETLSSIMNQIARWYDVTIIYEPGLDKTQTFGGKVSRNKNVSAVLSSMQSTGKVKFRISGKNVYVTK